MLWKIIYEYFLSVSHIMTYTVVIDESHKMSICLLFICDVAKLDEEDIDFHRIHVNVIWDNVTDLKTLRKAYARVVPKSGMYN